MNEKLVALICHLASSVTAVINKGSKQRQMNLIGDETKLGEIINSQSLEDAIALARKSLSPVNSTPGPKFLDPNVVPNISNFSC